MKTGEEILKSTEDKMSKAVEAFKEELKTVRTGRPNPEIFKKVKVECYGSMMALQDICSISVPDGQSFLIQPFDRNNLKAIETAIKASDLGLNPSNDGQAIRISVPPLSKDRRDEMVKHVSKLSEESGRVVLRRIRQTAKDELKKLKDSSVSEDDIKKFQDTLEKITSKHIDQIDEAAKKKEKELQTV